MKTTTTLQSKLSKIQSNFKSKKKRFNAFGKYNFRSAEDILEAIKPYLLEYGVTVTISENLISDNPPVMESVAKITDDLGMSIKARALVGVDLTQKGMAMPQRWGSASSYGKKYALGNLLLIDDTQDSDATNKHGKEDITPDQLNKAKEYIKGGGTLDAIKNKYSLNKQQEIDLKTL